MYCGGGHLGFPIGIKKNRNFVEDLPMIIPVEPYGKMFKCLLLRNYKYY
jgi:hypothetical protein